VKSLYDAHGGTVLILLRTVRLLILLALCIAFYQEFSKVQRSFIKRFGNLQPRKPFEYVTGVYRRKEKQVMQNSVAQRYSVNHKKPEK